MLGWLRKSNLPVDRRALTLVDGHLPPQRTGGARLVIFPDERTRAAGGAAANSGVG